MTGYHGSLAFLVYDSRSGSTLLSREVVAHLEGVFVTPEIGFDELFILGEEGLSRLGWSEVLRRLYAGHEFRNFHLDQKDALGLVQPEGTKPLSLADGIYALLAEFARYHDKFEPTWLVVKNGSHIRHWRSMMRAFGAGLTIIHVVRDPRAVINSKLRTPRPYCPQEVMAWGGPLLASVRWRRYVRQILCARQQGVHIHEIRYEDMLAKPERIMFGLAQFLGVKLRQVPETRTYSIPQAERSIHQKVLAPGIDERRWKAWTDELSSFDRFQIESICGQDMMRVGYPVRANYQQLRQPLAWGLGWPRVLVGTFRHFWLKMKSELRHPC